MNLYYFRLVYTLVLDNNGCVDTSECFNVSMNHVNENDLNSALNIYPNPSNGEFTIQSSTLLSDSQLSVFDMTGKLIFSENIVDSTTHNVNLDLAPGAYTVLLKSAENQITVKRIIID